MPWIDRTIRGPAAEYLTREELRKLFGLSEEWFDDRIKDGTMPPPITISSKMKLYTWEHAVFLSLWLKLAANQVLERPVK